MFNKLNTSIPPPPSSSSNSFPIRFPTPNINQNFIPATINNYNIPDPTNYNCADYSQYNSTDLNQYIDYDSYNSNNTYNQHYNPEFQDDPNNNTNYPQTINPTALFNHPPPSSIPPHPLTKISKAKDIAEKTKDLLNKLGGWRNLKVNFYLILI